MKEMKFNIGKNPELSRKVQERLFNIGYGWELNRKKVCHLDTVYLFAHNDGRITYGTDDSYYQSHPHTEVCPYEFTKDTDSKKDEEFHVILELFQNFLKEQDVFDKFLNNLEHYKDIQEYVCSRGETYNFLIQGAFLWDGTKEGLDFWSDIQKKWEQVLQTYNNNSKKLNSSTCTHDWKPVQLLFSTVYNCSKCEEPKEKEIR